MLAKIYLMRYHKINVEKPKKAKIVIQYLTILQWILLLPAKNLN